MMNKFFIAALFSSLILSSCTVFFPLNIAFPDQLMNQSIRGKIFNETPTYAGLEPDSLKTRDDVNDTFMNDNTVSFTTKNDGDTWIFEWEADQGNARNNKPLPLPKTLSFHFEGDSVVSWESEGIKLNALTKKERILIGFLVGLGLDVGVILISLANWSPNWVS
jgi:hypothetical protein